MLRDLGCILVLLVSSCSEKSPEKTQDEQTQLEKNPNAPFTFRVASNREQQEFEQREREFDPTNDGWNSEAFHGETTAQLKVLAESLSVNTPPSILSPSASATVLRPENLATIF